jgi:hypothetical protein
VVTKEVWSMSETPLPHSISDLPDDRSGAGDIRPRKRHHTGQNRAVSAFAPGHLAPRSEPPAASLQADDVAFAVALRSAGVASELTETELARLVPALSSGDPRARRTDLLIAYYAASGDPLAAQRRQATDRWFLYRAEDGLNAPQLLARLLNVVPELSGTELERVGGSNGTLVLRVGDDVCALEDEREGEGDNGPTVSVCDLVRAINVLLDRRLVRARIVGLLGDGTREAYVGLPSVTAAIALSSADYLAVADAEALLDLTGW